MRRKPTSTKRGPGRRHVEGHKKASLVQQRGAPLGFVQHTNPKRHGHRAAVIKDRGIRQWKRLRYIDHVAMAIANAPEAA